MEFKRGEVIEVSRFEDLQPAHDRIFLTHLEGCYKPFICVDVLSEDSYRAGLPFFTAAWEYARKRRPDLKVDDRVLVSSTPNSGWLKRHFKRWADDGRIVTFMDGNTSWSEKGFESSWDEYKLPEEAE
jgi:hypothetical protein